MELEKYILFGRGYEIPLFRGGSESENVVALEVIIQKLHKLVKRPLFEANAQSKSPGEHGSLFY
jgi:hypothetical protein